ncbi:hypothetical protein [Thermogutta sp.]|uniref:hypothetical protein n=1 Tax=Thermogutta sp. TaxID=1962930 RepID=UPI00322058DB
MAEIKISAEINPADVLEAIVVRGDLARLSPEQRLTYYKMICESLGLNPLTRPFEYIYLNGKLVLYARRDATDQLRRIHRVSITHLEGREEGGLYIVTVTGRLPDGRQDVATGAVPIEGLSGDAKANAIMKAETKAKRRLTLSLCGLGILDETEVDIPRNHWSGRVRPDGQTVGNWWLAKAAEKRGLTVDQIREMIGELYQYASPADAVAALDKALEASDQTEEMV